MSAVTDLLEAYSKLRKRRYSLSERLVTEQETGKNLNYLNRELPGLTPEIADSLLNGLRNIQQAPVGTPFQPWQTQDLETGVVDSESVTWLDQEGKEHTANAADLEEYLTNMGGEEGAVGEPGELGAEALPPPPATMGADSFELAERFDDHIQRIPGLRQTTRPDKSVTQDM